MNKTFTFNHLRRAYEAGTITAEQVYAFVEKGHITEEQYREICGIEPNEEQVK